ncbi:hypothetical protein V8F20_009241 [Naviculisporaceae sp. PSN 640]
MPRKRAIGAKSSSEQPIAKATQDSAPSCRADTAPAAVNSKPLSRGSSSSDEQEFHDAQSEPAGTTMDRESVNPGYNTRRAKRVRNDTPDSPSSVRRSKRQQSRRAASNSPTGETGSLPMDPPPTRTRPPLDNASASGPSKPTAKISRRLRNTITDDMDTDNMETEDSSLLSSPPKSSATGVSPRSYTQTPVSGQNDDGSLDEDVRESDAQPSDAVLDNIRRALAEIPIGEIAYGRLLKMDLSPEITIKGVGPITFPLTDKQIDAIRDKAHKPFEGKFGADWPFNSAHRLTAFIDDDQFDIEKHLMWVNGDKWGAYVSSLVSDVATYLGFIDDAPKILALPRSLCLWEKGSIWRSYTKPHPERAKDWIGTMLLILDHDCQGGEIAARYKNKDILFEHAAQGRFLIASHAETELDVMPLTEGYRFGMTYELYIPDYPKKRKLVELLVDCNKKSESELAWELSDWIARINKGEMKDFPVFQALQGDYGRKEMTIYTVNASDRALVLAVLRAINDKHVSPRRGRALNAYFAHVKVTSKKWATDSRTRYSVEWASSIDGKPRPDITEVLIDARGILQKARFLEGQTTRHVTPTMSSSTAMVQCLMLVWEKVE